MIEIRLPKPGPEIENATITTWESKQGDKILVGDILAIIKTPIGSFKVAAEEQGILEDIIQKQGATINFDEPIAILRPEITISDFPKQAEEDDSTIPLPIETATSEESEDHPDKEEPEEDNEIQEEDDRIKLTDDTPEEVEETNDDLNVSPKGEDDDINNVESSGLKLADSDDEEAIVAKEETTEIELPEIETVEESSSENHPSTIILAEETIEETAAIEETTEGEIDQTPSTEVSPAAQKMAERMNIDLATLIGTGEAGKILYIDVEKAILEREAAETASIEEQESTEEISVTTIDTVSLQPEPIEEEVQNNETDSDDTVQADGEPLEESDHEEPSEVIAQSDELAQDEEQVQSDEHAQDEEQVQSDEIAQDEEQVQSDEIAQDEEQEQSDELAQDEEQVQSNELAQDEEQVQSDELAQDEQQAQSNELAQDEEQVQSNELAQDEEQAQSDEQVQDEEQEEESDDESTEIPFSLTDEAEEIEENVEENSDQEQIEEDSKKDSTQGKPFPDYDEISVQFHLAKKDDLIIPFNTVKKSFSEIQSESNKTVPHFHLFAEVDFTEAEKWHNDYNQRNGTSLTVTDIMVKACGHALALMPEMNAFVRPDRIILKRSINIGVTTSVDEGVVTPVVPDVYHKSLQKVADVIKKNKELAETSKVVLDYDTTFTITNLGEYGVKRFIPTVATPQTSTLGVGQVSKKVVPIGDFFGIRKILELTLSCDHRAIDGTTGARFIQNLVQDLESFTVGEDPDWIKGNEQLRLI